MLSLLLLIVVRLFVLLMMVFVVKLLLLSLLLQTVMSLLLLLLLWWWWLHTVMGVDVVAVFCRSAPKAVCLTIACSGAGGSYTVTVAGSVPGSDACAAAGQTITFAGFQVCRDGGVRARPALLPRKRTINTHLDSA